MTNPYEIAAIAFAVVMSVMIMLTGLLATFRWAAGWHLARAARAQAAVRDEDEGVADEELIAVLAAAARVALGVPVRIHRVHVHRERRADAWGRVGRMDILASHRVVPKR